MALEGARTDIYQEEREMLDLVSNLLRCMVFPVDEFICQRPKHDGH